jgi:general bacterial porin, GBP family
MKLSPAIPIVMLLAASGAATAQSNITIYGIADAGIVNERGGAAGNVTKVSSGVASASRLGFKGSEELGAGVSALFVLEAGISIDTGALASSGQAFNRQSFLGLASKDAGSLTVGRQYTLTYNALGQVGDPFGSGLSGSAKNLFPVAGANLRANNSIIYTTPVKNGFSAGLLYSLGETAGDSEAGSQYNVSINYAKGPVNARLAHNHRNNDSATLTGTDSGRNTLFVANVDFKVVKVFFAYSNDKGLNSAPLNNATPLPYGKVFRPSLRGDDTLVGVTIPVGPAGTIMTSYIRKNDKTTPNQDAAQYAVGYVHALSKRTSAYTSYGMIDNRNGAGYTVGNNAETGSGDRAFNIGLRHTF